MRRSAVPLVAVLAVAALVGLLVYGVAAKSPDTTIQDALAQGDRPAAPEMALPLLGTDETRSLSDYRGQVVVLNFWASWCSPCETEAPVLERAQQRLEDDGAGTVLGVTVEDASKHSLRFMEEFGLTYPSLRDVSGEMKRAFETTGVPETFVIDPEGRITTQFRGAVEQDALDGALDRVLAQ